MLGLPSLSSFATALRFLTRSASAKLTRRDIAHHSRIIRPQNHAAFCPGTAAGPREVISA